MLKNATQRLKYRAESAVSNDSDRLSKTFHRFCRNRLGVVGLCIMVVYLFVALLGPVFLSTDPSSMDPLVRYAPPSWDHLLGTDSYGRDIFARVVVGARASLRVAVVTLLVSGVLGTTLGLAAGYFRGKVDSAIMRVVDILLSFPSILMALVVVSVFGIGLNQASLALGIAFTPSMIRVTRASALSVREEEYVMAAIAFGEGNTGVMFREMLPNVISPVIVQGTLMFAYAILAEASLSYLGLSAQPPAVTWGVMVSEGQNSLMIAPWASLAPGAAIVITVLGLTFLGEGVRDALDPQTDIDTAEGNL